MANSGGLIMSNNLTIVPCEFKNVRSGEVSYGYRLFDDYTSVYDNTWESIPDDDMEFLKELVQAVKDSNNNEIMNALEFVVEWQNSITIGKTEYQFEEIKEILQNLWD